MISKRLTIAGSCFLALTACSTRSPQVIAPAETISIQRALVDVADGISGFENRLMANRTRVYGVICKIEVMFNVEAAARLTQDAGGQVSGPVLRVVNLQVAAKQNAEDSGKRGNQVTIEMTGTPCLPKDTLGASAPRNIGILRDELLERRHVRLRTRDYGITAHGIPPAPYGIPLPDVQAQ